MKLSCIALLLVVYPTAHVLGQLVLFDFTDGSLAPAVLELNLGSGFMETDSRFNQFTNASGWDSAAQISGASGFFSTPTSQSSAGDALRFELTAAPGYQFAIHEVRFDARSTVSAPPSIGISINDNLYDNSGQFGNNSTITTVSQTGLSLENLTVAQISIQGWNASGAGALQLDNIAVFGSVTAIPEPSTYAAFIGLLAISFAYLRRRSRRHFNQDLSAMSE